MLASLCGLVLRLLSVYLEQRLCLSTKRRTPVSCWCPVLSVYSLIKFDLALQIRKRCLPDKKFDIGANGVTVRRNQNLILNKIFISASVTVRKKL